MPFEVVYRIAGPLSYKVEVRNLRQFILAVVDAEEKKKVEQFSALDDDVEKEDGFFSSLVITPVRLMESGSETACIDGIEKWLAVLNTTDASRYSRIHKGTAFYFLSVAAYMAGDFEKALFYMDRAVEQDLAAIDRFVQKHPDRVGKERWQDRPAGAFLLLDDTKLESNGATLVRRTRAGFDSAMDVIRSRAGSTISMSDLTSRLIAPAVEKRHDVRTLVTGLYTFWLEFTNIVKMMRLADAVEGSTEPSSVNLLKGAVLLESLIRTSSVGKSVTKLDKNGQPMKPMLGDFLRDPGIRQCLRLPTNFQGLGEVGGLDEIGPEAAAKHASDSYDVRSMRVAWAIRNTAAHALAQDPAHRLCAEAFDELWHHLFCAIVQTIKRLDW